MKIARTLSALAVCLGALALPAQASLIGDEVDCDWSASFPDGLGISGECSLELESEVFGPATVTADGFSNPEFLAGFAAPSTSFPSGGLIIDIGADYVEMIPVGDIIGLTGNVNVNLTSLDWIGQPNGIISDAIATAIDLDVGTFSVTHGPNSLAIAIEDATVERENRFRIDLVKDIAPPKPVPAPGTLALIVAGLIVTRKRVIASRPHH